MTHLKTQVLVVEDHEIWQKQFLDELQEIGLTGFSASTKEDAVALLDQHRFDLAVIDINLTDVTGNRDGLYVIDTIESRGLPIPVIVVSGSEEGIRALRERPRQIFAEIRKDQFDLENFLSLVKAAIAASGK